MLQESTGQEVAPPQRGIPETGMGFKRSEVLDGLAPTFENIVELEREVAVDNADLGSLKFLTNPKVRAKLRNTVIGTDMKMVYPEVGNQILGYDALITTLVPSNLTKGRRLNPLSHHLRELC